jgi:hypothetical protein
MRYSVFLFSFLAIFLTTLFFDDVDAQASEVTVTGLGCVRYPQLTPTIKDKAERLAKEAAFKKFRGSKLTPPQKSIFKKHKNKFMEALEDDLISEASIQREKDDAAGKKFCVLMSVTIDRDAVDQMFIDNSAAGQQETDDASDFGALFVARVEASRQSYDTKRADVRETSENAVLKEGSSSTDSGSVDSQESKSLSVKKSGGSSKRQRDKVEYTVEIEISEDLGEAIGEQLNLAGFSVMDVQDLDVPPLDELVEEGGFRASGGLKKRVEKGYKNAAIDAGWEYLGFGKVDISAPKDDTATGLLKVTAKVSFKVWKLSDGRAKTVASVRKRIITVVGDDPGTLETDAANKAAKEALGVVLSIMQKKGLR